MKQRNSLVSNSSSSSFIVLYKAYNWEKKKKVTYLSKKEIGLLDRNDFRCCRLTHPSHLDNTQYDDNSIWIHTKKEEDKEHSVSYAKWITCNQNDVIYFLLKNKIPFSASVHYGHELWVYQRNSRYVYIFKNYGSMVETYYRDENLDEFINSHSTNSFYEKINIQKFIKQEKKFIKEWNKKNENKIQFSK